MWLNVINFNRTLPWRSLENKCMWCKTGGGRHISAIRVSARRLPSGTQWKALDLDTATVCREAPSANPPRGGIQTGSRGGGAGQSVAFPGLAACLSRVTGKGRSQLDVKQSGERPLPLVSVLPWAVTEPAVKHAWLVSSRHSGATGHGGECSLAVPSPRRLAFPPARQAVGRAAPTRIHSPSGPVRAHGSTAPCLSYAANWSHD